MELYAYYSMPSHVHFVFRSSKEQPMELLIDFKRYTANKVIEAIINYRLKFSRRRCYFRNRWDKIYRTGVVNKICSLCSAPESIRALAQCH